MKRTIVLLAAISCCSTAIAGSVSTGLVPENDDHKKSIVATSQLTLEELTTIISTTGTNTALIGLVDSADNKWSVSVGSWGNTCQLHIYQGKVGGEAISGNASGSFSDADLWPANHDMKAYFGDLSNAVEGAITLGYQGDHVPNVSYKGTAVTLSVLYNDGTIKTMYGLNTTYKWSGNYIANITYADSFLGTPQVTTSATPWTRNSLIAANEAVLVPEPATATLSLLALAGLAARRRRK